MLPELSSHAQVRASQRNFSEGDMQFIVEYGERLHRAGVIFFRLRWKDIPMSRRDDEAICDLVGATVVVCKCARVILTVYYASDFRKIKRKAKYNRNTGDGLCLYCQCGVA